MGYCGVYTRASHFWSIGETEFCLAVLKELHNNTVLALNYTFSYKLQEFSFFSDFKIDVVCVENNKRHRRQHYYDTPIRNHDTSIYHAYGNMNNQVSLCECKHHIPSLIKIRTLKSL